MVLFGAIIQQDLAMKVNHVNVLGVAHVQQVEPHPLLLVHYQARQIVDHPINGWKERELQSIKNLYAQGGVG